MLSKHTGWVRFVMSGRLPVIRLQHALWRKSWPISWGRQTHQNTTGSVIHGSSSRRHLENARSSKAIADKRAALSFDSTISNCAARRGEKEVERSLEDGLYITLYSQGELRFRSRDEESVLRAGDFLLWETGTQGEFECGDLTAGQTILFPRRMVERRLGRMNRISAMQPDPRDPRTVLLRSHFEMLHQLAGRTEESIMRALLETSLELTYLCSVREGVLFRNGSAEAVYARIRQDIAEHLASDELSPLTVSRRVGMSVRQLQQVISTQGKTFTGLVAELRVERATEMLRSPAFADLSICEIALSLGFYDNAHFSNTFKKLKKISPRLYRNTH